MESVVIDFQGFKDNRNNFIIKELALQKINNSKEITKPTKHYLFLPPFDFKYLPPKQQKQAAWLKKNHHSFLWRQGVNRYGKLINILQNIAVTCNSIYTKGTEKRK